jgi:hypothetical protein
VRTLTEAPDTTSRRYRGTALTLCLTEQEGIECRLSQFHTNVISSEWINTEKTQHHIPQSRKRRSISPERFDSLHHAVYGQAGNIVC